MERRPILSPGGSQSCWTRASCPVTIAALARSTGGSAEASWRSVLGPESRLPNVFWGAMSPASLRRMSYYTALPPAEQVLLEGEATYRYVRQDTALWSSLHAGRLTTSCFKDALGLRDHAAFWSVGGPQRAELGVQKAYTHLQQPPYVPQPPVRHDGATAARRSEAEVLQLNEAVRLQFNEAMSRKTVGGWAPSLEKGLGAVAMVAPAARSRRVAGRTAGGGAQDCTEDRGSGDLEEEDGWRWADRRRISELAALAVGSSGAVRMRLLWGTVQEASSVATLSALFPTSQLEEVGLLCLLDSRPWGIDPHELPPLGASPDALITHEVPITRADLQAARADLNAVTGARQDAQHGCNSGGGGSSPPSSALLEAARRVARVALRSALVRHAQAPSLQSGAGIIPGEARPSSGNSHTDPSLCRYRSPLPPLFTCGWTEALEWLVEDLLRHECGCTADDGRVADAATADGRMTPCSLAAPSWSPSSVASPSQAPLSVILAAQQQQQQQQQEQHHERKQEQKGAVGVYGNEVSAMTSRGRRGWDRDDDAEVVRVVQLREVVEVKNHCPFVYKGQRKAKKRGPILDYVVRDRGPIESVWPVWAPQLQLHMACSGADSALLLSRSPTRGVRLFRMFRDDAYIETAFGILRELQCSHVARRQPPGCDAWVGRAGYEDFVQHTVALARAAETIVATSGTPQLPGTDQAAFWEMRL